MQHYAACEGYVFHFFFHRGPVFNSGSGAFNDWLSKANLVHLSNIQRSQCIVEDALPALGHGPEGMRVVGRVLGEERGNGFCIFLQPCFRVVADPPANSQPSISHLQAIPKLTIRKYHYPCSHRGTILFGPPVFILKLVVRSVGGELSSVYYSMLLPPICSGL